MCRRFSVLLSLIILAAGGLSPGAAAEVPSSPAALLAHLVGRWELSGDIAGQSTIHDVEAAWAVQGRYVRIDERSREMGADGQPQYEATIYVGWSEEAHRYVCFWLDNTGVATGDIACTAAQAPNAIPLEFRDTKGTLTFANTFVYDPAADTWAWQMDNVSGETRDPFGRVILHRSGATAPH